MSFREKFEHAKLHIEDSSPTILTAVGCVAVVGSAVLAVRQGLKHHNEVIDNHHEMIDAVNLCHDNPDVYEKRMGEKYTEEDYKKDLAISYAQTAGLFIKTYGPSLAMMAVGIGCICKGHSIMLGRTAALSSALNALQAAWNKRNEVAKVEQKAVAKGDTIDVPETATNNSVKNVVLKKDLFNSPYSRTFDSSSRNWEPSRDYQLLFLKTQQNMANDLLRTRGHVFLNEIYDMLDLPRSPEGALVGWVKSPDNGDGFVDFNLSDPRNFPEDPNFIAGAWKLDFNVDGVIYNLI